MKLFRDFVEAAHAGAPISVWLGYPHEGIPQLDGTVIHSSKLHRAVVCTSLHEFTDGNPFEVLWDLAVTHPDLVRERALAYLGKPYSLFRANCQHFVRLCQGLPMESPAVQRGVILAASATTAIVARNPRATLVAACASAGAFTARKNPAAGAFLGVGLGLILIGLF